MIYVMVGEKINNNCHLVIVITDTGTHVSQIMCFRLGNIITMSKRIKKKKKVCIYYKSIVKRMNNMSALT